MSVVGPSVGVFRRLPVGSEGTGLVELRGLSRRPAEFDCAAEDAALEATPRLDEPLRFG